MNFSELKIKKGKITPEGLKVWNIIAAIVLAIEGILVLVLSTTKTDPVTTNFLGVDPLASQAAGHQVLAAASRHLFDINLAYIIAFFLFASALFYAAVASIYRNNYEADLKKSINCARWAQYGLSAGLMVILIGLLVGVYDLSTLIAVFLLTAIACVSGLVVESTKKTGWAAYVGVTALALPWIIFAIYLISTKVYGSGSIPAFIYWLFFSLLVLFGAFAVNAYLIHNKKRNWSKYLYGEWAYIVLCVVTESALAWQVFAGTLR